MNNDIITDPLHRIDLAALAEAKHIIAEQSATIDALRAQLAAAERPAGIVVDGKPLVPLTVVNGHRFAERAKRAGDVPSGLLIGAPPKPKRTGPPPRSQRVEPEVVVMQRRKSS